MPFVTTSAMLKAAQQGGYAVGAFNFENMEMCMAIIAASSELRSPVILQTTPSTIRYAGAGLYSAIAYHLACGTDIPVALHLDHGDSYELAVSAMANGYSSVMIDGSHLPYEHNVALTRRVVNIACAKGIPVEAELGRVGGKEDDTVGGSGGYTEPDDAVDFVSRTQVGSLAVAIGTAHGIYHGTPVLDVERLSAIRQRLAAAGNDIPLVLHGASGLSSDAVRECVGRGICKVNFATELRQAFTSGWRKELEAPELFDPKKPGKAGMGLVMQAVRERIRVCGSEGHGVR